MTFPSLRTTAISLAAAAALTLTAASIQAQNYPNGSQPQYPNSNAQPQPQQQPNGYPDAQPRNSYPGYDPSGDRDRRDDRNMEAPHNWTTDQIITATVHQAWILSGQNEENFFAIVRELAEISAHNRNLVLPEDPGAGRRAGQYIKEQSRADHDQLLYDIVDKSVRMTGTPMRASR